LFVFDADLAVDLEENPSVEARQQIIRACDAPEVQLLFSEALSRDRDESLLIVRAEPGSVTLERHAEKMELEKRLTAGDYAEFSRDRKHLFYQQAGRHFFTSLERQRLLLSLLEASANARLASCSDRATLPPGMRPPASRRRAAGVPRALLLLTAPPPLISLFSFPLARWMLTRAVAASRLTAC
jgi:hypothetical protein